MKKHDFTFSRKGYYIVMSLIGLLMLLYFVRIVRPLLALAYHQKFVGIPLEKSERAVQTLETAIRFDRQNSQYHQELGTLLHRQYAETPSLEKSQQQSGFQSAAASLKQAVMLNPGDQWNYYELARLSLSEGDGSDIFCSSFEAIERCRPAGYFLEALKKSPSNLFLRRTAGRWLYDTAPEKPFEILQQFAPEKSEDSQESSVKLSQFLYDIREDYKSDLQYQRQHGGSITEAVCSSTSIIVPPEKEIAEQKVIELGSDDGSDEWRAFLSSETARLKKVICLPEDVKDYRYAALKIMMNHVGSEDFIAWVYVDGQLIKTYDRDIPRRKQWYEIPFDPRILDEKPFINVYVRVEGASYEGKNYLQIWADRDSTTKYSSRDYHQTDDLSSDKGLQSGEYMIRLLLKKS